MPLSTSKPCGCTSQPTAGLCSHPDTCPGPEQAALLGHLAGVSAGSALDLALPIGAADAVPSPVLAVQGSTARARLVTAGASFYTPSAALDSQRVSLLPLHPTQQPWPCPPPRAVRLCLIIFSRLF